MPFLYAAIVILLGGSDPRLAHPGSLVVGLPGRRLLEQAQNARLQDAGPPRADCREWQACRQLALDAAARQEFEAFHDLAWRAVQTGPKNDSALMYLLARAQSLSGRPGDALVMLERLAAMGVRTEAAASEDFRRVRALPGWAASGLDAVGTAAATLPDEASGVGRPAPSGTAGGAPVTSGPSMAPGFSRTSGGSAASDASVPSGLGRMAGRDAAGSAPVVSGRGRPASGDPAGGAPIVSGSSRTVGGEPPGVAAESLRFTAPQFTPAGLAYDAVSRRFIVGDRHARKLAVVDEFSRHVANLASAQAAGFGEIAALEIDPHQGNLWVVSADARQTTLHKLQLVSGRSLGSYAVGEGLGPARFVDVAATAQSVVLVLDGEGHRLFQLKPKGSSLELAAVLPDDGPSSVAPASDAIAYVAHAGGVTRVDLASQKTVPLRIAAGVDLGGITHLRWHQGALIAVQQSRDGTYRAVKIGLDRAGRAVTAVALLDALPPPTDPTAAVISGDVLFYLTSGEGTEMIVKRVLLR